MYDVNVLKRYGINVNKCIEIFGNIEMYNETLKDFLDTVDNKIKKLDGYLQAGTLNSYAIDIHALKSDGKYLGFEELAKISSDLELACARKDLEYVKKHHEELLNEIKHSVSIAKLYFGQTTSQEVDSSVITAAASSAVNRAGSAMGSVVSAVPQASESGPVSVVPKQDLNDTIKINLSGIGGIRPIIKPKLMKDKILIVDDSSLIVKFVVRFLSDDYEVLSASDGSEAIKLLDDPNFRSDIKLCLLDLNMPNVDGYQVLEHCKVNDYYKDLPIAVESGVEDTSSLDRVNSYPIVGILLKPFKESDLRRVVEKSYATYF